MDSLSTENRESAIALLDENEAAHRYEDIPISSEQEKSTRPEHAKLESKSLDDVLENIEIPEINPESVAAILKSSQDDVKKAEEIVKIDDDFPEIKIEPPEENVEDHETFSAGKRKRRAPSRLISEDEPQKTVEIESPAKIDEIATNFEENLSSVESTPIKNEAAKRSNRYYSPEHTKLLIDLYERTNKYPSKEEMNEIAKIIGVLPNKILWWFSDRRRNEKKT